MKLIINAYPANVENMVS